jgi:hypothetical protein
MLAYIFFPVPVWNKGSILDLYDNIGSFSTFFPSSVLPTLFSAAFAVSYHANNMEVTFSSSMKKRTQDMFSATF